MARRRSKRSRRSQSGIGEINWLIPPAILGLIAYFLHDAQDVPYNFVGSYLWIIVFTITFILGLFYFSQFILPLDWREGWFEGLRLAAIFNFPLIGRLLGARRLQSRKRSPRGRRLEILSKGFYRHSAGQVPSHHALVLSKETILTRSAGKGYVRLNRGEKIDKAVDLRQHQREISFDSLSQDGIPLKGAVSVTFRAKIEENPGDDRMPFPTSTGSLIEVAYLDGVGNGGEMQSWADQIGQAAANIIISEISRFTFDELYQRDPAEGITPFEQIHRTAASTLSETFGRRGVDINDITVNYLDPPEAVVEQRIDNWRADWKRRKRIREVEGEVLINQRLQLARARAQIEIISNIANSIEQMRKRRGVDLSDIVAIRMTEAMEEAISDDVVTSLMPRETHETMGKVEQWLRGQSGNQDISSNPPRGRQG